MGTVICTHGDRCALACVRHGCFEHLCFIQYTQAIAQADWVKVRLKYVDTKNWMKLCEETVFPATCAQQKTFFMPVWHLSDSLHPFQFEICRFVSVS